MSMAFGTRAYGARSITSAKVALDTIINEVIKSDAGIALTKLAATTASRALVSDGSGFVSASSVTATELGYLSGVTSGIQAQLNAVNTAYSRRRAVIAVVANNTLAPATEVSGDRYILSVGGGAPHADWDGAAAGSIVEFNGTVWVATAPLEGYIAYNDTTNSDWLYVDDGSPVWQERAVVSTALASGYLWVGNGSGQATAVLMSGHATMDNTGAVTIASSILGKPAQEVITLIAGDITAQYIDLAKTIEAGSLILKIAGLPNPIFGVDYTLSTESGKTRITFAGDLATGGACALIATDVIQANYSWLV
jgi:hypothetical protein